MMQCLLPIDINYLTKVSTDANYAHHLKNAWTGATIGALTKYFIKELSKDVKDISSHLRVKPDPESIARLEQTFFSLACNYPKGDGDTFKECMEEHHPEYVLMHVPNTRGNIQHIVCESSSLIH